MLLLIFIQEHLEGKLRHTTMPIKTQRKKFNNIKISAPRARKYMGYGPKSELRRKQGLIEDKLCSGISITLMTTRSSHICSHQ